MLIFASRFVVMTAVLELAACVEVAPIGQSAPQENGAAVEQVADWAALEDFNVRRARLDAAATCAVQGLRGSEERPQTVQSAMHCLEACRQYGCAGMDDVVERAARGFAMESRQVTLSALELLQSRKPRSFFESLITNWRTDPELAGCSAVLLAADPTDDFVEWLIQQLGGELEQEKWPRPLHCAVGLAIGARVAKRTYQSEPDRKARLFQLAEHILRGWGPSGPNEWDDATGGSPTARWAKRELYRWSQREPSLVESHLRSWLDVAKATASTDADLSRFEAHLAYLLEWVVPQLRTSVEQQVSIRESAKRVVRRWPPQAGH
jgi:hypothetical protein